MNKKLKKIGILMLVVALFIFAIPVVAGIVDSGILNPTPNPNNPVTPPTGCTPKTIWYKIGFDVIAKGTTDNPGLIGGYAGKILSVSKVSQEQTYPPMPLFSLFGATGNLETYMYSQGKSYKSSVNPTVTIGILNYGARTIRTEVDVPVMDNNCNGKGEGTTYSAQIKLIPKDFTCDGTDCIFNLPNLQIGEEG